MAAIVPAVRPEPNEALIRVGDPVASQTWASLALLANYLRGTGACLVPSCFPQEPITAAGTSAFYFRTKPRLPAIQRIWMLSLSATVAGGSAIIRAPASTGTASSSLAVPIYPGVPNDVVYVEDLAAKSTAEAQISIDVQAAGQTVTVNRIECYEQTRPILNTDADDLGVDLVTLRPRAPIYDAAYISVAGVMDALDNADARRVGGLSWSGTITTTQTTYAGFGTLFALPVPLIGRAGAAVATSTWTWSAYMKVDAGSTGEIEVQDGGGSSLDTIAVTGTSYAWLTASTFVADSEDISTVDGIRGGSWAAGNTINFSVKRTAGAGSVYLAGVCAWDAASAP